MYGRLGPTRRARRCMGAFAASVPRRSAAPEALL